VQVFAFHLMPWPQVPVDFSGQRAVTIPNTLVDRERLGTLINQYLDQLVACEEAGLDGIAVNEHHQMPWGLMGSPNLAAAMLAMRTKRVKILVLGPALPLYGSPLRVAEEIALVDQVSGGRVIFGCVIGGPPEYHVAGIDPSEARGRFNEALDLIIEAWTRPGPFEHYGEYYKLQHVNPWLLPLQRPHPPVWVPGAGSPETIDMCVQKGFTYSALPFFAKEFSDQSFAMFRRKFMKVNGRPDPYKVSMLVPVYVAATDEVARQEYEEHFFYFAGLHGGAFSVPGYSSEMGVVRQMSARPAFAWTAKDWSDVEENAYAIVGSPQTVIEKLSRRIEETGAGNLMCMFHIGSLPHEKVLASTQLFASEVLPAIRNNFPSGPVWPEAGQAFAGLQPIGGGKHAH
jgi:alkanesulfonate monooxygenase SsuD/methylene tetrahydromethanopterin reductase-like flavin-dependent oxidoreductase (luciferase family)